MIQNSSQKNQIVDYLSRNLPIFEKMHLFWSPIQTTVQTADNTLLFSSAYTTRVLYLKHVSLKGANRTIFSGNANLSSQT